MIILGLNFHFHDSTACIVRDGMLVCAVEEERLSRKKHTGEFPVNAIDRCLKIADIEYSDIDHIAISADFSKHLAKKFFYGLKLGARAKGFFQQEFLRPYYRAKEFQSWFKSKFSDKKPSVHHVEHHLAHAVGSFLISPYETAALLSLDGSGEWSTALIGKGTDRSIDKYSESFFPNSLGSFYEAVTEFCGFRPNYDEGKTMGLAPFGDPEPFYEKVRRIVTLTEDNRIEIDLSYFNYDDAGAKRCGQKFYETFGQPREYSKTAQFLDHHHNVAASFQKVLEDVVVELCNRLHTKTQCDFLVIAGGVSLNSVMNGEILRRTPFKDVYIMPAAGDNGTALGAAFYVQNIILNQPRKYVHNDPFVGTSYNDEQIENDLKKFKLNYRKSSDICSETAKLLADGKIVGWFQGKMEIGPRALGARSILANPVYGDMKAKINAEVKYREPYRPFAPSIIAEKTRDFFDIDVYAPFMLKVCNVLEDKKSVIPAVTHVDGSARVQTVHSETNPLYHRLISELGQRSGVPIVLNTSFNVMGEPVVESPTDAVRCFFSTGLDFLAIGNFIVVK